MDVWKTKRSGKPVLGCVSSLLWEGIWEVAASGVAISRQLSRLRVSTVSQNDGGCTGVEWRWGSGRTPANLYKCVVPGTPIFGGSERSQVTKISAVRDKTSAQKSKFRRSGHET